MAGLSEPSSFLAPTVEKGASRRGATGRTQSRFSSTATERLRISTETTRRQAFF